MTKRLVKFRGTNDFARVNGRPRRAAQPHYTWNGSAWVISTGGDSSLHGPLWQSCNPTPFQGAMSFAQFVTFITINNNNQGGIIAGGFALGIAGALVGGLPGALIGVGIGAGLGSFGSTITSGGAFQGPAAPRFPSFNPNLTPCPLQDPLSFDEPTFEEFQQQYAAYLAGQVPSTSSNTTPMEAQ